MAVAGYFLIEGLSQFSGNGAAKKMLIVGGVLFQLTESICFISASALTYHSLRWRYLLFGLGSVLFCFSIGVMTLAQKTALQTGEAQAQANDEKREHIRAQLASLQQVIDSYRLNAEKQSKSIYKDSRALGQDSINRAAELEERKMQLSEELFNLNAARRQTSEDFFQRLEEVSGLPGKSTEFYFLVLRSLLLEMSGIILMSFGANLRAYNKLVVNSGAQADLEQKKPWLKKVFKGLGRNEGRLNPEKPPLHHPRETLQANATIEHSNTAEQDTPQNNSAKANDAIKPSDKIELKPDTTKPTLSAPKAHRDGKSATPIPAPARQQSLFDQDIIEPGIVEADVASIDVASIDIVEADSNDTATQQNLSPSQPQNTLKPEVSGYQLNFLATMVMDLYEQQLLPNIDPTAIADGLRRYCSQKVSQDTASILSKMINKRLDESC